MDKDAIVAWFYVRECLHECAPEAAQDPNFVRFMVGLWMNYQQEGIAMLDVLSVLRLLKEL